MATESIEHGVNNWYAVQILIPVCDDLLTFDQKISALNDALLRSKER